jgi:hypothetical protein
LSINLQTTMSGNWTETYSVGGTLVGTLQSLPANITYIGFGNINGSTAGSGDLTSVELIDDSVVPEPSTWAMMFLGALGLLLNFVGRRKRHNYLHA